MSRRRKRGFPSRTLNTHKFNKIKEKSSRKIGAFNKIVITKLRGSQV
ncbi:hypothetical protein HanXRQr2_Chr15g0699351 [Helianthus annuus]|uniref:Uncharacterized protein n=1 Tax=Helianthus annuus TaxID=4232 RepID=A0A9K3E2X7_HELAN|nr:hypothetical protein HanXRQr2_Chr15g0699351 [Helianthus annuus]